MIVFFCFFFFQAEDGIRAFHVTGVQTCALPISRDTAALHSDRLLRIDRKREEPATRRVETREQLIGNTMAAEVEEPAVAARRFDCVGDRCTRAIVMARQQRRDVDDRKGWRRGDHRNYAPCPGHTRYFARSVS